MQETQGSQICHPFAYMNSSGFIIAKPDAVGWFCLPFVLHFIIRPSRRRHLRCFLGTLWRVHSACIVSLIYGVELCRGLCHYQTKKRRAGSETRLRTPTASTRSPRHTGKGKLKEMKWTDLNLLTGCMHSFTWQSMQRLSHATLLWDTHTQARLPGATSVAAISTSPLKQARKKRGAGGRHKWNVKDNFAIRSVVSYFSAAPAQKYRIFFPHQRRQWRCVFPPLF